MKTAYSYIRFSTPDQALGDSERRQLERAEAYATANGLKLSEKTCFADRGRSAFHGKHRSEKGELKALLEVIKPGDTLLVEDCDRWSREDPLDALTALREHVRKGLEVVFLRTGTVVNKNNFADMGVIVPNFFGSLLANQESEKKSERIQAGWDKRRALARAGQSVRINRLPCWLAWDKDAEKVVVNEGKARTVRHIFELARAGHTRMEIVRKLRAEGVPTVSSQKKRAAWNTVMVRRLLSSKVTLGYYVQSDPPVAGVWPAIVPESLFHSVQREIDIAPVNKRPGVKSETNLFTGIAICGNCGKYHLNSHIGGKSGTPKLICQGGHRGQTSCGHASVPIELVEKSCLAFLGDADLIRPLLVNGVEPSKLGELQGRLSDAEKMVAKLSKLILGDDSPSATIYERLKLEESRAKQLRCEIENEQARERVEKPALIAYSEFCNTLPALREDKERRPELRKAIASVVEKLTLNPTGEKLPGGRRWVYELKLRGAAQPVHIIINNKPEGWLFESRRPEGLKMVA